MEIKQPHNEHELELAIVRRAGNSNAKAVRDRMVMANAIVGQLLGEGVAVKGGSSMLLRYGSENARFTEDFDTTRRIDLDVFLKGLRKRLEDGWCGFTGMLDILPQASPRGGLRRLKRGRNGIRFMMRPNLIFLYLRRSMRRSPG